MLRSMLGSVVPSACRHRVGLCIILCVIAFDMFGALLSGLTTLRTCLSEIARLLLSLTCGRVCEHAGYRFSRLPCLAFEPSSLFWLKNRPHSNPWDELRQPWFGSWPTNHPQPFGAQVWAGARGRAHAWVMRDGTSRPPRAPTMGAGRATGRDAGAARGGAPPTHSVYPGLVRL